MFFLKWIGRLGDNSVYHLRKLIYSLLRSLTINGFLAKLPPVVILARVKKGGDAMRVIGNPSRRAFADLNQTVTKVTILVQRA